MSRDAHIVVGYDGRPDSLAALSWAAKVASVRRTPVVGITIIDPREIARGIAWPDAYSDDIDDRARKVLARWPDVPFRTERHFGLTSRKLVESARNSWMLVVGSKGHGLVGEMLRGSVSQSAARHSSTPVVVVRATQNPGAGRIVVGSDGFQSSTRALGFACELARLTGDKVVALRAWRPAEDVTDRHGYTPPPGPDTIDVAHAVLDRTVDAIRASSPDVAIDSEICIGTTDRALVDASGNASLVVVGSQAHRALDEVLVGSVSAAVLHKARSPVAVVH